MADKKTKDIKDTKESKDNKVDKNDKIDLGLLEEDDEFEEFPAEVWKEKCDNEEEELNLWEDNWDDDNIEEDFSKLLKSELEKKTFV